MVFTAGLKPHLEISSPPETHILGLGGNYFIDLAEHEPVLGMFAPEEIQLGGIPPAPLHDTSSPADSVGATHLSADAIWLEICTYQSFSPKAVGPGPA